MIILILNPKKTHIFIPWINHSFHLWNLSHFPFRITIRIKRIASSINPATWIHFNTIKLLRKIDLTNNLNSLIVIIKGHVEIISSWFEVQLGMTTVFTVKCCDFFNKCVCLALHQCHTNINLFGENIGTSERPINGIVWKIWILFWCVGDGYIRGTFETREGVLKDTKLEISHYRDKSNPQFWNRGERKRSLAVSHNCQREEYKCEKGWFLHVSYNLSNI